MEGRLRLLAGPRRGRFPESTCPLVEYRGSRILVDTGCLPGLGPMEVDAVVYTHHHPDHIRGSHLLAGAPVEYSPLGEAPYRSLRRLAWRFAPQIWREWLSMALEAIGALRVPGDRYYEPGEDVCFRGLCLKTAPAPGHLATHTLVELPGGILHLADIDLTGFGPWYGNPESDPLAFLADIELAATWGARAYTTSHRPGVLEAPEAQGLLARYTRRLAEQLGAVLEAYRRSGPTAPGALVGRGIIYRRIPSDYPRIYEYFEYNMILKASNALAGMGCLRRTPRGYEARGHCGAIEEIAVLAEAIGEGSLG
ncbi:MAG: MBL fold metallo-hydrolase [Desulfurococcales archaeon]|nr:MBL fold metallo-hydrolase [Desulfurococcales archaeon]